MQQQWPASDSGLKLYRSFIAIPLPETFKRQVAATRKQLRRALPQVRWSPLENLHLTLRFLGDQTEESLEQIALSMLSVGRLSSAFKIQCRGLGVFPAPRRARVLWLGLEPATPLIELQQRLNAAIAGCGSLPDAEAFRPHLTLGRIRGRAADLRAPLAAAEEIDCGFIEVTGMTLYESRLLPSGARHLPRATVRLGGA